MSAGMQSNPGLEEAVQMHGGHLRSQAEHSMADRRTALVVTNIQDPDLGAAPSSATQLEVTTVDHMLVSLCCHQCCHQLHHVCMCKRKHVTLTENLANIRLHINHIERYILWPCHITFSATASMLHVLMHRKPCCEAAQMA